MKPSTEAAPLVVNEIQKMELPCKISASRKIKEEESKI